MSQRQDFSHLPLHALLQLDDKATQGVVNNKANRNPALIRRHPDKHCGVCWLATPPPRLKGIKPHLEEIPLPTILLQRPTRLNPNQIVQHLFPIRDGKAPLITNRKRLAPNRLQQREVVQHIGEQLLTRLS